jgi:hypothetical protein
VGRLAVAVAGLGMLAACSGGGKASGSATRAAAGARTTSTTSLAASSTSSSSTAPPTTTAVDRCSTTSSQVAKLEGLAATGHFLSMYSVKNTSGRPCRVLGYPGVSLLDTGGRVMAQGQRKAGFILTDRAPTALTVAPGQAAFFGIESTSVCTGDDAGAMSDTVQVTLPDDTVPAVVADQIVVCAQPNILVSPVRATQEDVTRR